MVLNYHAFYRENEGFLRFFAGKSKAFYVLHLEHDTYGGINIDMRFKFNVFTTRYILY